MALALTGTTSNYFKDSSAPLSNYQPQGAIITQGQLLLNAATSDIYICVDATNQSSLVWQKLIRADEIIPQVQSNWTQSNNALPSYIANKPTIPAAQVNSDWNSVSGLSQVLNKPSIPSAQVNSDWNAVSGVSQILNKPTIPSAQVQSDWTQSNSASADYVKNKPIVRSQASFTRTLNTIFQISSTRDAMVNYSVDIACTISLVAGQTGTVFLEIASDSGFTANVQELARGVNGNTGTLTIGLNLTQNCTTTLSGYIPIGYYCRLRTANTVGAPSFNYRSGQEILL